MPTSDRNKNDETRLVSKIIRDDKEAFKELYFIYYEKLFRFAWNRTGSEEAAAEFVQELFVRVWTKRKTLDASQSIQAFLFRTLKNLIIDVWKARSSKNVYLQDERVSSPEKNLELKIDLDAAVKNLPPKIREVYLLSRYDKFKYSEIADICGISVKAVEKRMAKALTTLRKIFHEKYFSG